MTHEELHELEYSNLQAAIEHVRTAPLEFMLQVMWDKGYSQRLRIEAAKLRPRCRSSMVRRLTLLLRVMTTRDWPSCWPTSVATDMSGPVIKAAAPPPRLPAIQRVAELFEALFVLENALTGELLAELALCSTADLEKLFASPLRRRHLQSGEKTV